MNEHDLEVNRLLNKQREMEAFVGKGNALELEKAIHLQNGKIEKVSVKVSPSKPGRLRNKPCPCGSGRKFKKCCIDKEFDDE